MSDQTTYLTFDDGPLGGTDDVIAVLNEMKVKGTLFMDGRRVTANVNWGGYQVTAAHTSSYVEAGNHSHTRANHKYKRCYQSPDEVVKGFDEAEKNHRDGTLGVLARLNKMIWRVALLRTS